MSDSSPENLVLLWDLSFVNKSCIVPNTSYSLEVETADSVRAVFDSHISVRAQNVCLELSMLGIIFTKSVRLDPWLHLVPVTCARVLGNESPF